MYFDRQNLHILHGQTYAVCETEPGAVEAGASPTAYLHDVRFYLYVLHVSGR